MKMNVCVSIDSCELLKDISFYNNNYYRLPGLINGCDILYEHYYGDETHAGNILGTLVDGKFVPAYYVHQEDDEIYFIFDSNDMDTVNR